MRITTLGILLAAVIAAPAYPQADQTQSNRPVRIATYKVKPGSIAAFEDVMKKHREAHKKAGREFFMVWRGFMGDRYEFTTMTAISGLGVYDGPNPFVQAFGEGGAVALQNRLDQCLDGSTAQLWHLHPDQSIVSAQDFQYARVVDMVLRSDSAGLEHSAMQRKVVGAQGAAGMKNFWTLNLDYGGDDYRILYITPVDNLSALAAAPNLTKLMGAAEAAKISAAREQSTLSRRPYIWSYRPELSYRNLDTVARAADRFTRSWRLNLAKSPVIARSATSSESTTGKNDGSVVNVNSITVSPDGQIRTGRRL